VSELQQGRYDQLLRRVGDLKGPGSKVNDVLQELFPTIDVENVPGELLFLLGTRIGWAGTSVVPTAGKASGIQLLNPADSGQLVTVSSVFISAGSSSLVSYGLTTVALATNTGIPRHRDGRVGVGPSGVSQLRTSPDAVAPLGGLVRVLGATTFDLTDGNSVAVLSPGAALQLVGTVDVSLQITFYYRERIAEPSELSFP